MTELAELKELIEGIRGELKANTVKVTDLLAKIDEKDNKIAALEERVNHFVFLEERIAVLEKSNSLLQRKCDDNESYTRRQNVRIVGIPEPENGKENADECFNKVTAELDKLELSHLKNSIDRAHRVGPRKDKDGNVRRRAMIVRFVSWHSRTEVYQKRPKVQGRKVSIYVDLTKRRFSLLKMAKEKTNGNAKVKFAFADINNNICLMLTNDVKKFFNSEEELDNILENLQKCTKNV